MAVLAHHDCTHLIRSRCHSSLRHKRSLLTWRRARGRSTWLHSRCPAKGRNSWPPNTHAWFVRPPHVYPCTHLYTCRGARASVGARRPPVPVLLALAVRSVFLASAGVLARLAREPSRAHTVTRVGRTHALRLAGAHFSVHTWQPNRGQHHSDNKHRERGYADTQAASIPTHRTCPFTVCTPIAFVTLASTAHGAPAVARAHVARRIWVQIQRARESHRVARN